MITGCWPRNILSISSASPGSDATDVAVFQQEDLQVNGNHWQAAVSIADGNVMNSET